MSIISFKSFIKEEHRGKLPEDLEKTLYKTRGGYKIYLVDAFTVRNSSKSLQEFSNFGTHIEFPDTIPEKEVWIDKSYDKDELKFYMEEIFKRMSLLKQGVHKDKAYDLALRYEKAHREKVDLSKYELKKSNEKVPDKVYVSKYCYCEQEDVEVWFVDGRIVRDLYKTDFVEGVHDYVVSWVPNNEIWIEMCIHAPEAKFILLHETIERKIMKEMKLDYEVAHNIAADIEYNARETDEGIDFTMSFYKDLIRQAAV